MKEIALETGNNSIGKKELIGKIVALKIKYILKDLSEFKELYDTRFINAAKKIGIISDDGKEELLPDYEKEIDKMVDILQFCEENDLDFRIPEELDKIRGRFINANPRSQKKYSAALDFLLEVHTVDKIFSVDRIHSYGDTFDKLMGIRKIEDGTRITEVERMAIFDYATPIVIARKMKNYLPEKNYSFYDSATRDFYSKMQELFKSTSYYGFLNGLTSLRTELGKAKGKSEKKNIYEQLEKRLDDFENDFLMQIGIECCSTGEFLKMHTGRKENSLVYKRNHVEIDKSEVLPEVSTESYIPKTFRMFINKVRYLKNHQKYTFQYKKTTMLEAKSGKIPSAPYNIEIGIKRLIDFKELGIDSLDFINRFVKKRKKCS